MFLHERLKRPNSEGQDPLRSTSQHRDRPSTLSKDPNSVHGKFLAHDTDTGSCDCRIATAPRNSPKRARGRVTECFCARDDCWSAHLQYRLFLHGSKSNSESQWFSAIDLRFRWEFWTHLSSCYPYRKLNYRVRNYYKVRVNFPCCVGCGMFDRNTWLGSGLHWRTGHFRLERLALATTCFRNVKYRAPSNAWTDDEFSLYRGTWSMSINMKCQD